MESTPIASELQQISEQIIDYDQTQLQQAKDGLLDLVKTLPVSISFVNIRLVL